MEVVKIPPSNNLFYIQAQDSTILTFLALFGMDNMDPTGDGIKMRNHHSRNDSRLRC